MTRRSKFFVCALLALAAALASLPWWLSLPLRPILRARNITYERYEREGYAHFRLRAATYQRDRVTVTVETIHSPTPVLWLIEWLGSGPRLEAENWSLKISPIPGPAVPDNHPAIHGPPDLLVSLRDRVWPRLNRWLPYARFQNGVLRGPGLNLTIQDTQWDRGTLQLSGVRRADFLFDLITTPSPDGSFAFTGSSASPEATLKAVWSGAQFSGNGSLWAQPIRIDALFPDRGWLPSTATATAEHWSIAASRAKLPAPYSTLRGSLRFDWGDRRFTLAAEATAEPAKDTKAPLFSARALAHGTLRDLTLTDLQVTAPFATATLTGPITFSLDHPVAAESAQLSVQADLAKFPWFQGRGKVNGSITVNGDTLASRQTFEFESRNVVLPGLALDQARVRGNLHWPLLELTTLEAQLDKASRIAAHGTVDWQTRELTGALQAKVGSAALARWRPAGLTWATADLAAVAEGPLDAPRHHGSLTVTGLQWAPLKPLQVTASWQGAGARADAWSAHLATGRSSIDLDGAIDAQRLKLDKFQFNTGGSIVWQLNAPARLAWAREWRVDSFQLTGPTSQLALAARGGPHAAFSVKLGRFDSAWLQDWVAVAGPAWQVNAFEFNGHAEEGTLVFDTAAAARIELPALSAQVKLTAHGDASGLQLSEFTVSENGRALTQAKGRLPVVWHLKPTPHLQLDENAPLELSASTDPESPLWAALAASTRLQFTRPEATINLSGTLRQPAGDFQLQVAKLAFAAEAGAASLPEATDLNMVVHFDRTRVTVSNFSAKLDGQDVQARGELPMSDAGWQQLWRRPGGFDWSEAEGKVEIPDADLAPFARRAPAFVAALGRLRAEVTLTRGGNLAGELHLTNASSRPLPLVGTVQEINADLALAGRTVTVRSLTARLGGEPVAVEGHVTLPSGAVPRLSLTLKGTKLPLVRTAGLLVRSDVDVHATTDDAGVTRLTGTVRVRDSLALANFNSLLPTGLRSVTRVPPYFAVTTEPFRTWPLDIDVRGSEAIKVRTTVFAGTASARFHLGGTLGEPRAVGDLNVDQGSVLFPFASFKVQQGTIRLSEADPFHARINLVATSQRRDYQLRLEVTGELPTPVIAMSSTPALDATDVLLLVMTGRPPSEETAGSSVQRLALLGAYLGRGLFGDLGLGGEDRLEISSGEQISTQGRETYELEYKLGERWSLVGEYDQFDSYNADVKRRIFIQESVPNEKK